MRKFTSIHLAVLLFAGFAQLALALDAPSAMVPSGLSTGDKFYIMFVTKGTIRGDKTAAEYQDFVNAQADLTSAMGTDDPNITWRVWLAHKDGTVWSSSLFSEDNTKPIYDLGGRLFASSWADLKAPYKDHAPAYNQYGNLYSNAYVWTGLDINGNSNYPLADNVDNLCRFGLTAVDSADCCTWTASSIDYCNNSFRMYAVSPLLTVPANFDPIITEGDSALSKSTDEDTALTSFTLNATDADNDTITWSISTAATHGTASVSNTPTGTSQVISYTPTADYFGTDSFVVKIADGKGGEDTITINVTIVAVNDAPSITTNTGLSMAKDSTRTISSDMLAASDVDDSADSLTFTLSPPSLGNLWVDANSDSTQANDGSEDNLTSSGTFTQKDIDDGKLKYTALSTLGNDAFAFNVADGNASSASGTFNLSVVEPALSYATTSYQEKTLNDGSTSDSVVITLAGDTFDNNVVTSSYVSASNVPAGLTAQFTRDSDTQITMKLTGNASPHTSSSNENNLSVQFTDSAFVILNASQVLDSLKTGMTVNFYDNVLTSLTANTWNMITFGNDYTINTATGIESSYLASGYSIWAYDGTNWSENPTEANAAMGLWAYPTGTEIPFTGTANGSANMTNASAQAAYIKTLSTNKWHLVGLPHAMNWSDLSSIKPSGCSGFSLSFYYDSANGAWNTTNSIPANSALWVRHICQ